MHVPSRSDWIDERACCCQHQRLSFFLQIQRKMYSNNTVYKMIYNLNINAIDLRLMENIIAQPPYITHIDTNVSDG